MTTWKEIVEAETKKLGHRSKLEKLLELARGYKMTEEEIKVQRESWARQDKD